MKDSRQILQDRNSSCSFSRRLDRLEGVLAMVSHSEKYQKCNISIHTYSLVYVLSPLPQTHLGKTKNKKSFSFCFLKSPQHELLKTIPKFKSIREKVRKKIEILQQGNKEGAILSWLWCKHIQYFCANQFPSCSLKGPQTFILLVCLAPHYGMWSTKCGWWQCDLVNILSIILIKVQQ